MRSNLRDRKNIMTGMGSGSPANQALAGANNPNEAAQLAANQVTPEELEDRKDKLKDIQDGFIQGFPEVEITEENLEEVHAEYIKWRDTKIDKELEEEYFIQKISADDPLYNPMTDVRRKERIEKNLESISFEDMIFKGYSDQEIEIRNGFTVVLRTITTQQSLWIEKELSSLSEESMQYGRHYFSLKQLSCSLQSINGNPIGGNIYKYRKASDYSDFKAELDKKFEFVTNLPQEITDDLIVQYVWFSGRVRKCLAGDVGKKLGN